MTGLEIFLLILVAVLAVVLGAGVRYALLAGRKIRTWEDLFTDTFEEMTNAAEIFHSLVYRRTLLADDPEIQRLVKVFDYTLSILESYINNGKELTPTEAKKEGKGQ